MRRRESAGLMASCHSSVKSERPHGVQRLKKEQKKRTCDGCWEHDVTRMEERGAANPSICLENKLGRGGDGNEEAREGSERRSG